MDRMPEPLRSWREYVEADLRRAARLIIKIQDEIDLQFRVATLTGDWHLAVTFPAVHEDAERKAVWARIGLFMQWKKAVGILHAAEIYEPDAVYCVGINEQAQHHCLARISREPRPWTKANFGSIEWLPPELIDPAVIDLLPKGKRQLTLHEVNEMETWFGIKGRYTALQLEQLGPEGQTSH